jgi:NADH:ubiquinone oxidoreductase subunit 4 (subunit M)
MREPVDQELPSISPGIRLALGVTAAMTLIIGIYPNPFIEFANKTVLAVMR